MQGGYTTFEAEDEVLLNAFPRTPGRVPDVYDLNGIPDHVIEYFVTVASKHLHAHIWVFCQRRRLGPLSDESGSPIDRDQHIVGTAWTFL
jgi:hypothetical protein